MSWGLIIGGGVSLIGAGLGAAGNAGLFGGGGGGAGFPGSYATPDYDEIIDYLNNGWTVPEFKDYTATPYTTGLDQWLGQSKYIPKFNQILNRTNQTQNNQFQQQLLRTSPNLIQNVRRQGRNTSDFLRGRIPADVLAQVQRGTAEQSLFGGFGNSGMARNLTARDLGLTSLDLMQRGQEGLGFQLGATQSLNPYRADVLNLLMTPQQLLATEIGQNQFGTNVYNQNRMNSASVANQRAQMIAGLMQAEEDAKATGVNTGNILQYQAAQQPSAGAQVASSLGGILSGLGGTLSSFNGGNFGGFGGYSGYGGSNYGAGYGGNIFGFNPFGAGRNFTGETQYLMGRVPKATAV